MKNNYKNELELEEVCYTIRFDKDGNIFYNGTIIHGDFKNLKELIKKIDNEVYEEEEWF